MRLKRTIFPLCLFGMLLPASAEVSVAGNKVNASFNDVSLETALTEIADATGIEVLTSQPLDKKLFVSFEQVSVEKLLNRLLYGQNATYLREPSTGQIKSVRLFAVGNAPVVPNQAKPTAEDQSEQADGKFYLNIVINGVSVRALVDTGASVLAISETLAGRLGIAISNESVPVATAGGESIGFRAVAKQVEMAGKTLENVDALVLPNMSEAALIGQNVLSHYRRITEGGKMWFEPLDSEMAENPASAEGIPPTEQKKMNQKTAKPVPATMVPAPQKAPPAVKK